MLENLVSSARDHFDLTKPEHQESLYDLVEKMMEIEGLESNNLIQFIQVNGAPLEFKIAAKLFQSRTWVKDTSASCKIGIVFAMWGEQNRLLPFSSANPNGEDILRTKLDQLNWLFRDTKIDWILYAVDDGCPYGSGKIAQKIADDHPLGSKVRIEYLADNVPVNSGPLRNLRTADDSRKGGAIILGCSKAILEGCDAVIYTDADNSVHLGQAGILLKPFIEKECKVVLGDRKHPEAVLVKQEDRWGVGIKLLRHMQRMVARSIFNSGIRDTQAAFKLYECKLLDEIIANPSVFDFSFDSDWIAAVIAKDISFEKVPFAFVDSFEESASITQGPMTTWETLLLGLVKSVRARDLDHNEEMAVVLDDEIKSSHDLDLLINHLPTELDNVPDSKLGDPEIMDPGQIKSWIRKRKNEGGTELTR